MNILITGSAGFIGYHLSKKLLSLGHDVQGIDNINDYYDISNKDMRISALRKFRNFNFIKDDINNINETGLGAYDLVINLAAQAGVRLSKKQYFKYDHSNVNGFKKVLNFCANKGIKKLIFASSSSVYGNQDSKKLSENLIPNPISYYGETKLLNETYAQDYAKKFDIDSLGLRFFTVYGRYGRPDMAYYLFSKNLIQNKNIKLNNNGDMARDMTHIDDIVDGIVRSIDYLMSKENLNDIFNLGNDSPIPTSYLLRAIEERLNKKAKIIHIKTNNEVESTHACLNKSKKLLGYSPKISFNDGIQDFIEWVKSLQ